MKQISFSVTIDSPESDNAKPEIVAQNDYYYLYQVL